MGSTPPDKRQCLDRRIADELINVDDSQEADLSRIADEPISRTDDDVVSREPIFSSSSIAADVLPIVVDSNVVDDSLSRIAGEPIFSRTDDEPLVSREMSTQLFAEESEPVVGESEIGEIPPAMVRPFGNATELPFTPAWPGPGIIPDGPRTYAEIAGGEFAGHMLDQAATNNMSEMVDTVCENVDSGVCCRIISAGVLWGNAHGTLLSIWFWVRQTFACCRRCYR
jgi:hypothetical protein